MKNNIIYYNLYATYDKLANTIGLPFVAQNNAVALRKLNALKEEMKKEGITAVDDISVMYLGQYTMTPIFNKDKNGNKISIEPIFTDLDNAYDILDCFDNSRERETVEKEVKIQEKDKNMNNYVFIDEDKEKDTLKYQEVRGL
nr:MAG TPA: hypothetical protein [Microviridae sp.]